MGKNTLSELVIHGILSRASGVGSPTNHLGSRQRQDTGPGILWSVNRWIELTCYLTKIKKELTVLWTRFTKAG